MGGSQLHVTRPQPPGTVMSKTLMPSKGQLTGDWDVAVARGLLTAPARVRCRG